MLYKQYEDIVISSMEENDIDQLYKAFKKQGWHKDITTLEKYYLQQQAQTRVMMIARKNSEVAGYLCIKKATIGPFCGEYEVKDFNVFQPFQHQQIGYRLLCTAEDYVFARSDCITLAVGLHEGYGKAQRLYIRNGYVPDGSGIWYQNKPLQPYTSCINDDDLVLYLRKEKLHGQVKSSSMGAK